jgi:hypothetical protein
MRDRRCNGSSQSIAATITPIPTCLGFHRAPRPDREPAAALDGRRRATSPRPQMAPRSQPGPAWQVGYRAPDNCRSERRGWQHLRHAQAPWRAVGSTAAMSAMALQTPSAVTVRLRKTRWEQHHSRSRCHRAGSSRRKISIGWRASMFPMASPAPSTPPAAVARFTLSSSSADSSIAVKVGADGQKLLRLVGDSL